MSLEVCGIFEVSTRHEPRLKLWCVVWLEALVEVLDSLHRLGRDRHMTCVKQLLQLGSLDGNGSLEVLVLLPFLCS